MYAKGRRHKDRFNGTNKVITKVDKRVDTNVKIKVNTKEGRHKGRQKKISHKGTHKGEHRGTYLSVFSYIHRQDALKNCKDDNRMHKILHYNFDGCANNYATGI